MSVFTLLKTFFIKKLTRRGEPEKEISPDEIKELGLARAPDGAEGARAEASSRHSTPVLGGSSK